MATSDELRGRARATWAAGDWDRFARLIAPVGERVLERAELAGELARRLRPLVAGAPERLDADEFLERLAAAKADRA